MKSTTNTKKNFSSKNLLQTKSSQQTITDKKLKKSKKSLSKLKSVDDIDLEFLLESKYIDESKILKSDLQPQYRFDLKNNHSKQALNWMEVQSHVLNPFLPKDHEYTHDSNFKFMGDRILHANDNQPTLNEISAVFIQSKQKIRKRSHDYKSDEILQLQDFNKNQNDEKKLNIRRRSCYCEKCGPYTNLQLLSQDVLGQINTSPEERNLKANKLILQYIKDIDKLPKRRQEEEKENPFYSIKLQKQVQQEEQERLQKLEQNKKIEHQNSNSDYKRVQTMRSENNNNNSNYHINEKGHRLSIIDSSGTPRISENSMNKDSNFTNKMEKIEKSSFRKAQQQQSKENSKNKNQQQQKTHDINIRRSFNNLQLSKNSLTQQQNERTTNSLQYKGKQKTPINTLMKIFVNNNQRSNSTSQYINKFQLNESQVNSSIIAAQSITSQENTINGFYKDEEYQFNQQNNSVFKIQNDKDKQKQIIKSKSHAFFPLPQITPSYYKPKSIAQINQIQLKNKINEQDKTLGNTKNYKINPENRLLSEGIELSPKYYQQNQMYSSKNTSQKHLNSQQILKQYQVQVKSSQNLGGTSNNTLNNINISQGDSSNFNQNSQNNRQSDHTDATYKNNKSVQQLIKIQNKSILQQSITPLARLDKNSENFTGKVNQILSPKCLPPIYKTNPHNYQYDVYQKPIQSFNSINSTMLINKTNNSFLKKQ